MIILGVDACPPSGYVRTGTNHQSMKECLSQLALQNNRDQPSTPRSPAGHMPMQLSKRGLEGLRRSEFGSSEEPLRSGCQLLPPWPSEGIVSNISERRRIDKKGYLRVG